MKVWKYGELKDKVLMDLDLQDELQVQPDELVGYCNEAIDEAEAEILTLHEDYFLKDEVFPFTAGQSEYDLPSDCYGAKIRGFMYNDGSRVYPISRFRNLRKFEKITDAQTFGSAEDYRYFLKNPSPRSGFKIVLVPPARATESNATLWYIRNAQRIPLIGEYAITQEVVAADVNVANNTIAVDADIYVTGDRVKFTTDGTLPAGLTAGTVYYVIRASETTIKLATTAANATNGVAVDITDTGSGTHYLWAAATEAIQDELPVDIPEFANFVMQYMKVRCLEKEGSDPRFDSAVTILQQQRKMMVDTLTQMVPDDDTEIEGDFSHYDEMS